MRSSPEKDRFISNDELLYIQSTISVEKEGERVIPWKSLLTSRPVYALTAAQFALNWGYNTMLTQMPSFLAGLLFPFMKSTIFMKVVFRCRHIKLRSWKLRIFIWCSIPYNGNFSVCCWIFSRYVNK